MLHMFYINDFQDEIKKHGKYLKNNKNIFVSILLQKIPSKGEFFIIDKRQTCQIHVEQCLSLCHILKKRRWLRVGLGWVVGLRPIVHLWELGIQEECPPRRSF